MPILTEMPAVAVAAHSDDSAYPALGWQQHAVFQGVQRLAVHRQHLHDLIQAARYAHAPIGRPPAHLPHPIPPIAHLHAPKSAPFTAGHEAPVKGSPSVIITSAQHLNDADGSGS